MRETGAQHHSDGEMKQALQDTETQNGIPMMETGAQHQMERENLQESETVDKEQMAILEAIFEKVNHRMAEVGKQQESEKEEKEVAQHQMLEMEAQQAQPQMDEEENKGLEILRKIAEKIGAVALQQHLAE